MQCARERRAASALLYQQKLGGSLARKSGTRRGEHQRNVRLVRAGWKAEQDSPVDGRSATPASG